MNRPIRRRTPICRSASQTPKIPARFDSEFYTALLHRRFTHPYSERRMASSSGKSDTESQCASNVLGIRSSRYSENTQHKN
jgi:hypothetical protein